MFQRSADLGLGIPFNIASYALLTHMIARVTGTEAHELIIQLGDAHVYRDHVDALQEQLKREPKPFPRLRWARDDIEDIEYFIYSDFVIEGYMIRSPQHHNENECLIYLDHHRMYGTNLTFVMVKNAFTFSGASPLLGLGRLILSC